MAIHRALGPGQVVGGWRLVRLLGRGALSTVFLAEGVGEHPVVALKIAPLTPGDAAARASFLQQAQAVAGLSHPDIVALYGAGIDEELSWVAMEAVPGSDLGRYTEPQRLLPEPVVLQIGERIARALAHAHRQGLVHRDLKPANVLIHWPNRTVKLADFGLARSAGALATRTGVVPGTPAYMAPEQLAGGVPDARADLYALGVTLFELLTGRLPHKAATMGELLRSVAREPAPHLRSLRPDLPGALGDLLAQLLAIGHTERLGDALVVADALAALAVQWRGSEAARSGG